MPATANLVHELSASTGTGNFTLTAQNGKQRFSTAFGTGVSTNVFDYFISNQDAAEWERGTGHMSAVGTLVRDTVIESTNANAAVNFSVGTKDVTNDVPAGHQVRAESVISDNSLVRGDGGAAGVQASGITVDDTNNVSGIVNLAQTGYHDFTEIAEPASPAANVARLRAIDDGAGITTFGMKDNAGNIVPMSHFKQSGTGAITRTQHAKAQDVSSAKDFGALGDGLADDTAALNAAHATGNRIYYPSGTYLVSDMITVPNGGASGDGQFNSIIRTSHLTADVFLCTGSEPIDFRDLRIDTSVTKTDGAGIRVNPAAAATDNDQSSLENLQIGGLPYGIKFDEASTFLVGGCYIYDYLEAGIFVDNVVNPDAGDSFIHGCTLDTTKTSGTRAAVLQQRSGGLKIIGNKFLRGQYGHFLALQGTVDTSILLIVGNSFEHQTLSCIRINRASTANYSYFVINGNQLNGQDVSGTGATPTVISFSDAAWRHGIITNNVIQIGQNGGIGIELGSLDQFIIQDNTIFGNTGAVRTGISLGANAVNGIVGVNRYENLTSNLLNASASVLSVLPTSVGLTHNCAVKSSSPTAGIGYDTGAGGVVTQLTSKTTTVVLNKVCGEITMNATAGAAGDIAAGSTKTFTMTNSAIAVGDNLLMNHPSAGSLGHYLFNARCTAGQAVIDVKNTTGGTLNEAIVIRFQVMKGVTS